MKTRGRSVASISRCSMLALCACAVAGWSGVCRAEEATCKLVFDAMARSAVAPSHQFFSRTIAALNGGKPQSGENINTGKEYFVQDNAKWKKSGLTPDSMKASMDEAHKKSTASCKFVRDEAVDGVGASLYSVHEDTEGGAVDSKVWVGKTNSLPVHITLDLEGMHSDTRYVYGPVSAPAL